MTTCDGSYSYIAVTPSISSGVAYSAEDQVGGVQTISQSDTDSFGLPSTTTPAVGKGYTTLLGVTVIDKAKQNQPLTIFLFDKDPSSGVASSDNAAINISDGVLASSCVGHFRIFASHYENVSSGSVANAGNGYAITVKSDTDQGKMFAVVKTTGTPNYGSSSDLIFKYYFEK